MALACAAARGQVDVPAGDADRIYTSTAISGWFGHAVSGAGDVDDDGFDDVIVGAYVGGPGFVRVYSGLTGTLLWEFLGETTGDQFGESVGGAGDADNDGNDDLVVGAPNNGGNGAISGRVFVYSGLTGEVLHTFTGVASLDRLGESVAGAGDVDGDGHDDVVAGAPGNDTGGDLAGQAYVFSGRTGAVIHTFTGALPSGQLGSAVDGADDVDADGRADVIVGAIFSNFDGQAFVFSGATGELLFTFDPEPSYVPFTSRFGESVASAGDVNADGRNDLLVGAPTHTPEEGPTEAGSIFVFSGLTGQQLYRITGEGPFDDFGSAVSGFGDLDGDGSADFLVGARLNDGDSGNVSDNRGRAYLYSGRTQELLVRFTGEAPDSWFGDGASGAGDANGDGVPDVIVGAPRHNNAFGSAYVFFMSGPQIPGDLDGDGSVGILDLLMLLAAWGPCTDPCPPSCPADLDGDCNAGITDLLILLASWG